MLQFVQQLWWQFLKKQFLISIYLVHLTCVLFLEYLEIICERPNYKISLKKNASNKKIFHLLFWSRCSLNVLHVVEVLIFIIKHLICPFAIKSICVTIYFSCDTFNVQKFKIEIKVFVPKNYKTLARFSSVYFKIAYGMNSKYFFPLKQTREKTKF